MQIGEPGPDTGKVPIRRSRIVHTQKGKQLWKEPWQKAKLFLEIIRYIRRADPPVFHPGSLVGRNPTRTT